MSPLTRKLEHFVRLSASDRAALELLTASPRRTYAPRENIICEGESPRVLRLALSGWACRYKTLEDGRRAIVGLLLPGDLCDLNVFILRKMDHSLAALTPVSLAEISSNTFNALTLAHPRVLQALWWETLVRESIQRQWTANLSQRDASERVASLLCEVFTRLHCVGLTDGPSCDLALTQAELGEATGLSTVHVNRTVQELRARGLIILRGKSLTIPDFEALRDAALFSADYLHLDHEGAHLDGAEG
ncbi:transcriptional regulator, Crp/Fnr family [Methylobacterium sp. 4-46]|uniref:Crp/Fnr family transcriptional regulator n=1 Tax=unclassified Methylobacterium TaxID=2615210 RepID=UPI000152BFDD|nr:MULTISPECIES: Crp/Fnr family transcriptional regulator [Methylobacterium]ACA20667.1 transcriptional regulator, Crp/Fnr family [Methylobacterium sp. 4-46]WFT79823.1 Crp/Fnr family transcriptional regulator [Methylobacterium nodulans]